VLGDLVALGLVLVHGGASCASSSFPLWVGVLVLELVA